MTRRAPDDPGSDVEVDVELPDEPVDDDEYESL
jgi:hypothetical protein